MKNMISRRLQFFMLPSAIFAIAIFFALFTNHTWEDYYITYRTSKNLATGNGLVYTVGEKLHVFTSPLNVLLPAALIYFTGNTSDRLVLWLFRILCSALLAISAVLLITIARVCRMNLPQKVMLIVLFAFSAKIIGFSVNGQEAALMVFFILLTLHTFIVTPKSPVLKLGLSWAGLLWSRPDGFVYILCIAAGFFLFPVAVAFTQSRRNLIIIYIKSAVVAFAAYAPWLIWAWYYYGSPVPHTIIAKGLNLQPGSLTALLARQILFPLRIVKGYSSTSLTFLPAYAALFGGWPQAIFWYSRFFSALCALFWIMPTRNWNGRAVSFSFFAAHFYLSTIVANVAPWYLPFAEILAVLVLPQIIRTAWDFAISLKTRINKILVLGMIRAVFFAVFLAQIILFVCVAYQLRIQQRVIEEGNRMQIGLWFRQNASCSDTVFLEPLGYIGYFSQLKMFDYPGLSSREVVSARKKIKTNRFDSLIRELKPRWVVIRPIEYKHRFGEDIKYFETNYSLVKTFSVSDKINSYPWLPGRNYLLFDSTFWVFKHK